MCSLLPTGLKRYWKQYFLWRKKGWILLLLTMGRAMQCFICITGKVTGAGPGKVWAILQSAVVPWGVCPPCLCKEEQFVQMWCLNSGRFCWGTLTCVQRDICSIAPQGSLHLFRSNIWLLRFCWGLGLCVIHVHRGAEFRFKKELGAVCEDYSLLNTE